MIRAVIDTNVVVSAFISGRGVPAQIFRALHQDLFTLIVTEPILDEYSRALGYERVQRLHKLSSKQIAEAVNRLQSFAVLVDPTYTPTVVKEDPDDDKFFACAIAGACQFIVSGDKRVLQVESYQEIQVVSPEEFLAHL